ncbi:MAG: 30S ribosome-binding factor RbfA [bacterium]|jgi:ribosome-binding factor A
MTQKKSYRIAQVNRLLKQEIADVLLTELQDERLHGLTVTEVRTSRDLKHAIVFITTHKKADPKEMLDIANRSGGLIRKILYNRIRLRHIPELNFQYDESLDRAESIFRTLQNLDLEYKEENSEQE